MSNKSRFVGIVLQNSEVNPVVQSTGQTSVKVDKSARFICAPTDLPLMPSPALWQTGQYCDQRRLPASLST